MGCKLDVDRELISLGQLFATDLRDNSLLLARADNLVATGGG
jgi:hypothetical protein